MTRKLDWKWILIGVAIMVVLNFIAGLILVVVVGSQIEATSNPAEITLTGGQVILAAVLNFLAFAISSYIVGLKSVGRTILEPGISASQTCKLDSGSTYRCGQEAAFALAEFIGRRTVSCEDRGRDRYDRMIAVCRASGTDLSAWLVEAGWAVAYRKDSDDYLIEEAKARI